MPSDNWKVVASPLGDSFRRLARHLNRSSPNARCKHDKHSESQDKRHLPQLPRRPGSRLAGYARQSHAVFSPTFQSLCCCSCARLDQGNRVDWALPLLLDAILLPSHCPTESLSPLVFYLSLLEHDAIWNENCFRWFLAYSPKSLYFERMARGPLFYSWRRTQLGSRNSCTNHHNTIIALDSSNI